MTAAPPDEQPDTVMWEARAAEGQLDELLAFVLRHADPLAQVYQGADGPPRVVVIDSTGRGLPAVPAELIARPAHTWRFVPAR